MHISFPAYHSYFSLIEEKQTEVRSPGHFKTRSYQNNRYFFTIEVYLNGNPNLETPLNISDVIDDITRKGSLHYYHISWLSPRRKITVASVVTSCQIVVTYSKILAIF